MFFNVALFAGILLAPEVLAIPSGLDARITRRRASDHQSHPAVLLEEDASASYTTTTYTENWAGAVWTEADGTFTSVTGTFTVPTPSGSSGDAAAAWVGIDGYSCQTALLQTGVDFIISSDGQPTYVAWYEWVPAAANDFSGITISAGDVIKLTVTADSTTSGTATIENLTNSETVSINLTSSSPLCLANAEWIVEDYQVNGQFVPFVNFGTVTFTNAQAGTYTPSGANITDINQNNTVLTSVEISGSSVTIQYV